MHWLILTDDHPPRPGGVSVFVSRVARELVSRGMVVRVVARHRAGLEVVAGTHLGTAWVPSFSRLGGAALALRAIPSLVWADRILATTWPMATGLQRLGAPYDVVAHGSDVTCAPRDPDAFCRVWAGATRGFAMSRFLADQLSVRSILAKVLPAPVSAPGLSGSQRRHWVMVARATPRKGGDRFVRWVAAAGVRGVVVGDGPERASWEMLAQRLGADVSFVGQVPQAEVAGHVSGAELAVLLPTGSTDGAGDEGLGFSLLEAAGLGVPCVGTRVGGVPEAIGPGLIVDDPEDVPSSLAAIRAFLASGDRAAEALDHVRRHHGVARTVDALIGSAC